MLIQIVHQTTVLGTAIRVLSIDNIHANPVSKHWFIAIGELQMNGCYNGYWYDQLQKDVVKDASGNAVKSSLKIVQGSIL